MLEKADKLGRHGVSTGTIKSFFNAHTDDQYQAAMKQLDGNDKSQYRDIDSQGRNNFLKAEYFSEYKFQLTWLRP